MTAIVTPAGIRAAHVVVPLAETAHDVARLSFDNGLAQLNLRAGEHRDSLMEADFADPLPLVWANGNNAHVEYPLGSRLLRRMRPNAVRVNSTVPWALDVHGGAEHIDADLTGLDVRSIAFHSGAAHLRIALGRPSGPTTIRLTSVEDLRIERPTEVPVRLEIAKGATKVALDERWFGAVGGGLTEQTSRSWTTEHCYHVIVSGGADTVVIGVVS